MMLSLKNSRSLKRELIDQYVRGELSRTDSDRFEKTLAVSPRLMERLQTARMFADRLRSISASAPTVAAPIEKPRGFQEKTGWWSSLFGSATGPRFAVAFSVLLVLIGGLALLFGWLRLREESRQLAAQQAAIEQRQRELDKQAADLKSQLDQLANRTPTPTPTETPPPKQVEEEAPIQSQPVLAFTLSPGTVRSESPGEKRDFKIAPGTSRLEISLKVPDTSYVSYQATIVNTDRGPVFKSSVLKIRGSSGILTVSVPTKKLLPNDYLISLTGRTPTGATEGVADYSFRITK